jgi:hypothetical protein
MVYSWLIFFSLCYYYKILTSMLNYKSKFEGCAPGHAELEVEQ